MFTKNQKLIVARTALVLALVVGVFGVMPVQASVEKPGEVIPAVSFLNPDGTLKLDGSVSGSLDLQGWDVSIDDVQGPVFSPKRAETLSPLMATTLGEWSALGDNGAGNGALNGAVHAIAVSGTDVYVGGNFTNAGGNPKADHIAKWNGTTWSNLGDNGVLPSENAEGAIQGEVWSIGVNGNDVYVGILGDGFIAKWDGTSWSGVVGGDGTGSPLNTYPLTFAFMGTDVYVGGLFTNVKNGSTTLTEADYLAKWDGTNWSAVGNDGAGNGSLNNNVHALAVKGTDLYVGGNFTNVKNGTTTLTEADYIAKWDGANWSALGNDNGVPLNGSISGGAGVYDIEIIGDDMYVVGDFVNINNQGTVLNEADYIAKWDGTNWSALGSDGSNNGAIGNVIFRMAVNNNDVYVAGMFQNVNNNSSVLAAADYIAKWDGVSWSALGSDGGTPPNGSLNSFGEGSVATDGENLYVGGSFTNVNNNGTVLDTADYIVAYGLCTTGLLTVQNTNDLGTGSLRQAIADICPGGTINFDSSLSGETITFTSTLVIEKDLTIDGSELNPQITISGNNTVGVLKTKSINGITLDSISIKDGNYLWGGGISNIGVLTLANCVISSNNSENNGGGIGNFGELTLTKVTISGNTAAVDGGGIYNDGEMTITDSIIVGNTADYGGGIYTKANGKVVNVINSNFSGNSAVFANGGGIYTFGTLDVLDSTFTNNTADGDGGAIYNSYESTLTVTRSTFLENSAPGWGGGIYNDATSILNITNSTFAKNSAGNGGAIFNFHNAFYAGILTVTNSTFSENSAVYAGGSIYNFGTLNLANSILANSVTGNDCYHDDFNGGTIDVNNNNLIETNAPAPYSCGTPAFTTDPNLGPLADNGGLTQTMALLVGSPAIDAGDDSECPATDQRGVTRPQGSQCDIGAYEFEHPAYTVLQANFSSVGTYDGWILESNETSNNGGTLNSNSNIFYLGDDAQNKQYRAILHFDTSSLPDNAVIVDAKLRLATNEIVTGTNPFLTHDKIVIELNTGAYSSNSNLQLEDFKIPSDRNGAGAVQNNLVNGFYRGRIKGAGLEYFDLGGVTQIRLRFKVDDDDDNVADLIEFFSGNASVSAERPRLVIYYYIP